MNIDRDIHFDAEVSSHGRNALSARNCTDVENSIVGCGSFRVIHGIEMILSQVVFHTHRKECASEVPLGKIGESIAYIHVPPRGWHHREFTTFIGLVQLPTSYITEAVKRLFSTYKDNIKVATNPNLR